MAVYPPSGSGGAHLDKAISGKNPTDPAKKAVKAVKAVKAAKKKKEK